MFVDQNSYEIKQSASRIWIGLTWLYFVMVVWLALGLSLFPILLQLPQKETCFKGGQK